jgi:hypothetical protein
VSVQAQDEGAQHCPFDAVAAVLARCLQCGQASVIFRLVIHRHRVEVVLYEGRCPQPQEESDF